MSIITFTAESREKLGKGASRRLRRLEQKVPGIIYGGSTAPETVFIAHKDVSKALQNENIFSSVFDVILNGKTQHVVFQDMQRHPIKPIIMHMDFLRVDKKDIITKTIPIHFLNETQAKGVKTGGIVNHLLNQVDIRCQAKDLPQFIELDIINMIKDDVLHLSDIKLPKGVQFATDISLPDNNHPVVAIHMAKGSASDESAPEASA